MTNDNGMDKSIADLATQFSIIISVRHEEVILIVQVGRDSAIRPIHAAYLLAALVADGCAITGVEDLGHRDARVRCTAVTNAEAILLRKKLSAARLTVRVAALIVAAASAP